MLLWTQRLSEELIESGVTVNAVNPGYSATKLRRALPKVCVPFKIFFFWI